MTLLSKKISFGEISEIADEHKRKGQKVVLCLGVFDLVHPGHIRHLQEAKANGDVLIVSVTANRFVNKGPDRPVFNQDLRMESVAAIECVDYVVLNDHSGGIDMINAVKPSYYVKGIEYKDEDQDVTDKIRLEREAVEKHGGEIIYTDDIVFSSSKLLNNYFNDSTKEFRTFIKNFKSQYSASEIQDVVESFKDLKVLVIGDAIIDEYVYTKPLGVSGKGTHLVARCEDSEIFLGGSFAVAQHIAAFSPNTTLLTAVGDDFDSDQLAGNLLPTINQKFLKLHDRQTLVKRRYVLKDGDHLNKLFETYSSNDLLLGASENKQIMQYLEEFGNEFDLILVSDFGNGLINSQLSHVISNLKPFLAINTQINSGNRGYHVVTKYDRANYISLNEPEMRLTVHDLYTDLGEIASKLSQTMDCKHISVTQGVKGVAVYSEKYGFEQIPALTHKVVDRVGAGDSYLSLSSLAFAQNCSQKVASFLGSCAAAMDVQIVGNKKCIEKAPFLKYVATLLK